MKKNIFYFWLASVLPVFAAAQSVAIGHRNPAVSAILDVKANGTYKSVTAPAVNLASKTDEAAINGGIAAESLLVYNTNPSVPGGKGLYYWDNDDSEWKFIVSQANMDLFRNLTKYYTASTQTGVTIANTPVYAGVYNNTDTPTSPNTFTMLPISIPITVDQPENFVEVNLTGTWIINNTSGTAIDRSIDFGYGIFIDGVLRYSRTDVKTITNACNFSNFYLNSVVPSLSVGNHTITFGVMNRRVRNDSDSNTNFPNNTSISLGGAQTACGLNAFEAETRATVYLNQTL